MKLSDSFKPTPQSILKNLVLVLHDDQQGFRKAAEDVNDPGLKDVFTRLSVQRSQFASALERKLLALGGDGLQNEGTFSGKLHRGWMDVKATVTGHDAHAILVEAERGEDAAVETYQDALDDDNLPPTLRATIERQAQQVKLAHDELKHLRDISKKS